MRKPKIIYWSRPDAYVIDTGAHFKDGRTNGPTLRGWVMWFLHRKVLHKRDPFFYREDYI